MDHDSEVDEIVLRKYKQKLMSDMNCQIRLPSITSYSVLQSKMLYERCIIHFYKFEFERCKMMNEKLEEIAQIVKDVKFYKVEAEKFVDICERMHVNTLPFLAFFCDGKMINSIVGFEEIGDETVDINKLLRYIKRSKITQ